MYEGIVISLWAAAPLHVETDTTLGYFLVDIKWSIKLDIDFRQIEPKLHAFAGLERAIRCTTLVGLRNPVVGLVRLHARFT